MRSLSNAINVLERDYYTVCIQFARFWRLAQYKHKGEISSPSLGHLMVTNTPTGFSVLSAEESLVPLEFYYKPSFSSVQVLFFLNADA